MSRAARCPPEEGHDLASGAGGVGGEGVRAGAIGDLWVMVHGPLHRLGVVGVRRYIRESAGRGRGFRRCGRCLGSAQGFKGEAVVLRPLLGVGAVVALDGDGFLVPAQEGAPVALLDAGYRRAQEDGLVGEVLLLIHLVRFIQVSFDPVPSTGHVLQPEGPFADGGDSFGDDEIAGEPAVIKGIIPDGSDVLSEIHGAKLAAFLKTGLGDRRDAVPYGDALQLRAHVEGLVSDLRHAVGDDDFFQVPIDLGALF